MRTDKNLVDGANLSTDKKYLLLIRQLKELLNKKDNILSNLSNLAAAVKYGFNKVSWVGFYLFDGEKLYLGLGLHRQGVEEFDATDPGRGSSLVNASDMLVSLSLGLPVKGISQHLSIGLK